jgi:hypothetical protein
MTLGPPADPGRRRHRSSFGVIAVEEDEVFVVIHVMDLRQKFRALYEEGERP